MRRPVRTLRNVRRSGWSPCRRDGARPADVSRVRRGERVTLDEALRMFEVGCDVGEAGLSRRTRLVEEYLRGRSLDQMSAVELETLGSEFVELARLAVDRSIQARKRPRLELIGDNGDLTEAGRRLLDDLDRSIDIPLDDEDAS